MVAVVSFHHFLTLKYVAHDANNHDMFKIQDLQYI